MINIRMQNQTNRLKPRITVVGVGGAGGNAVNNMISSQLEGCEFLVCNTDAQALEGNNSPHKLQMGVNVTRGLGAGANPEIGRAAAEESIDEIMAYLEGSNMVFVTAGMGGGTGTGAAAVIAQAARAAGILTVGVVTKPFHFEGSHRMKLAESGITELQKHVDTLIIIPNQNLFRVANEKTTFSDAFKMADEVLQSGVRGVTDLMVMPGLINLDFADIRAVMAEMGKAMMGTGEAEGERRAVEAAEAAISNPLLDDVSMKGARGVLINITGGLDMTLFEVDEAANRIRDEVDPDANIIFGSTFDQTMQGKMRVSVVATGIEAVEQRQLRPQNIAGIVAEHNTPVRKPAAPIGAARPAVQGGGGSYGASLSARTDYAPVSGGIPSSVMPVQASSAARAPVMSKRHEWTQPPAAPTAPAEQPAWAVGHAEGVTHAATATATARKLDESSVDEWQTHTKPAQPPQTQMINRVSPPVTTQPRGTRVGGNFIPPKPVDPKTTQTSSSGDLFAGAQAAEKAAKPVKKSPSLFERFTLQRKDETPVAAPARAEAAPRISVEEGGKKDEDELDIPAFLRRQAN